MPKMNAEKAPFSTLVRCYLHYCQIVPLVINRNFVLFQCMCIKIYTQLWMVPD